MARYGRLLTDAQWEKIRPLLPKRPARPKGGSPPANDRKVLEGILWILRSGARWCDLPDEFSSPATCWRRLRDWEEQGIWLTIWRTFLAELNQREQLDWSESFLDGSFAPAKKGLESRKNQAGQGHEVDGGGRRPGRSSGKAAFSASPNEVRLAEETLASVRVGPATPQRPASSESAARHCRSGLRQRSSARAVGRARYRIDRPASLESQQAAHPGWSCTAPIPSSLENRTHVRLARQLSPPGRSLRPLHHHLRSFFSYRLLHDHITQGFEMTCRGSVLKRG